MYVSVVVDMVVWQMCRIVQNVIEKEARFESCVYETTNQKYLHLLRLDHSNSSILPKASYKQRISRCLLHNLENLSI